MTKLFLALMIATGVSSSAFADCNDLKKEACKDNDKCDWKNDVSKDEHDGKCVKKD